MCPDFSIGTDLSDSVKAVCEHLEIHWGSMVALMLCSNDGSPCKRRARGVEWFWCTYKGSIEESGNKREDRFPLVP